MVVVDGGGKGERRFVLYDADQKPAATPAASVTAGRKSHPLVLLVDVTWQREEAGKQP